MEAVGDLEITTTFLVVADGLDVLGLVTGLVLPGVVFVAGELGLVVVAGFAGALLEESVEGLVTVDDLDDVLLEEGVAGFAGALLEEVVAGLVTVESAIAKGVAATRRVHPSSAVIIGWLKRFSPLCSRRTWSAKLPTRLLATRAG